MLGNYYDGSAYCTTTILLIICILGGIGLIVSNKNNKVMQLGICIISLFFGGMSITHYAMYEKKCETLFEAEFKALSLAEIQAIDTWQVKMGCIKEK